MGSDTPGQTGPSVGFRNVSMKLEKIIMERPRTARDVPVLVDRSAALALCGVSPKQFDRLIRAGRVENCVVVGDRELYRSAQCREIAAA
jgi:hypothetical protein